MNKLNKIVEVESNSTELSCKIAISEGLFSGIGPIQFRWIIQRNWLEFPLELSIGNVVSEDLIKIMLICLV